MIDDPIITPVAARLLACLAAEVAKHPKPPKYVSLKPGAQAPIMLDASGRDECCQGSAWVRLSGVVPSSTNNWPSADVTPQGGCGTKLLALTFELGVVRCAPTPPANKLTEPETWNLVSEYTYQDYIAMTRAICCYLNQFKAPWLNLTGGYTPLGVDGNCVGGTLTWTVAAPPCNCEDHTESPS